MKSAINGNKMGQFNVGVFYTNGLGVKKDMKEAIRWYVKSEKLGLKNAQYNLGVIYENGMGVKKDYKKSI